MTKKKDQPISGGKAVVECLKAYNIKYVFGLIGSATMELFDALYDEKSIKFIDVRDERTGTHMADAYARAAGRPGVIIAGQNGPGATNLVTGVAQAKAAFSPLVSIAGAIATEHVGKDAFQEVDQQKLFEPITKKTFSIKDTGSIVEDLNKALNLSTKGKWGPVHVNIPRDVLAGSGSFNTFKIENKIESKKIKANDLEKIISLIQTSSKPVIICGAGVKNSKTQNQIILLSKNLNIPKESARRKILDLEKLGVLQKIGKKIYIDRSAYRLVQPKNTLKNLSALLSKISEILKIENLIDNSLNVDEVSEHLKDNFSYCWYYFYIFIFTLTLRWKKQLGDLEIYSVGMVITCHSIVNKSYEGVGLNFSEWEKDTVNFEEGGVNTMSISEITGIPRPTVVRKLKYLIDKKYLNINEKKLISFDAKDSAFQKTGKMINQNMLSLSNFIYKVFNQIRIINP